MTCRRIACSQLYNSASKRCTILVARIQKTGSPSTSKPAADKMLTLKDSYAQLWHATALGMYLHHWENQFGAMLHWASNSSVTLASPST